MRRNHSVHPTHKGNAHHGAATSTRVHDRHAGHSVAIFRDKFWLSLLLTLPVIVWGLARREVRAMRGFESIRRTFSWIVLVGIGTILSLSAAGCAHVPLSARASFRRAEYFATHAELPSSISAAIEVGHVIRGMDQEQVRVVLGEPDHKKSFKGQPAVEVWLYRGHRLHQDPLRTHGVQLFRIVFLDGRAVVLEPI